MRTLEERIKAVFAVLADDEDRKNGERRFFIEEMYERTGWLAGTTTLHRHVTKTVQLPRPEFMHTLLALETEAADELDELSATIRAGSGE